MSKKDHIHKYYRTYIGGRQIVKDDDGKRRIISTEKHEVFRCAIPGCTTYKERALVIGDISTCWNCNEELIIDKENIKRVKPTHKFCRKQREVA